jgi:hypothetical protein
MIGQYRFYFDGFYAVEQMFMLRQSAIQRESLAWAPRNRSWWTDSPDRHNLVEPSPRTFDRLQVRKAVPLSITHLHLTRTRLRTRLYRQ